MLVHSDSRFESIRRFIARDSIRVNLLDSFSKKKTSAVRFDRDVFVRVFGLRYGPASVRRASTLRLFM